MGQNWTTNVYDLDHVVNTDMTNVEDNFATLKNSFAGVASPTATVAGQIYFNTSKKIHHFLNATESDFLGLLPGDLNTKIWQYRNDATPGWIIDNSVTDKVIALKGGSDAYDINGGTSGGDYNHTHTISNHTHTSAEHKHLTAIAIGGAIKESPPGGTLSQSVTMKYISMNDGTASRYYTYTDNTTPDATGSDGGGATGGSSTTRPAAAVGTLQFPDVTQA